MRLGDFDYELPKNLIAQKPAKPRDHSRLLIVHKCASANCAHPNEFEHKHFYDLPDYLKKGDVLVLNNTKVFPARLIGKKKETGGKMEVFLLKQSPPPPLNKGGEKKTPPLLKGGGGNYDVWQCLVGGKGQKENLEIEFGKGLIGKILKNNQDGTWIVEFNKDGKSFMEIVNKVGLMPLPPYIKQENKKAINQKNKKNYQTIYAEKTGSVAAPTAGLHFTPGLLKKLKKKGVQIEDVTLHVGLGTFAPVKVDNIKEHKMHSEWVEADKKTLKRIATAKREGRRILAVGTTSVRTLETVFQKLRITNYEKIQNFLSWTDIFIYPGYKFKIIDAMITNFHLPKSTLLMLVSAFAGKKEIDRAYQEAIQNKYRFYSYGDAMLIF